MWLKTHEGEATTTTCSITTTASQGGREVSQLRRQQERTWRRGTRIQGVQLSGWLYAGKLDRECECEEREQCDVQLSVWLYGAG